MVKEGVLGVYVGITRHGKTTHLINDVVKSGKRRVIIWSPKESTDRYHEKLKRIKAKVLIVSTLSVLKQVKNQYAKSDAIIIYTGGVRDFSGFCHAARSWGMTKPCAVVAEELADVTSPAKAPKGWGELCRQILGAGCDVYAVTQRPAESDKTAFNQRTYLVIHTVIGAQDIQYLRNATGLTADQLQKIPKYSWIRCQGSDKPIFGKLQKPA